MRRLALFTLLGIGAAATTNAQTLTRFDDFFTYHEPSGKVSSAPVIKKYYSGGPIVEIGRTDSRIDPKLRRAATIAEDRANAHSRRRCWAYVKQALISAGVIDSRPESAYAKEAGYELVRYYGFKRLPVRDPYAAPVGAVLVYGNARGAGHVEIRTRSGFVSDFRSPTPSRRPLLGVYTKS